MEDHRRRLFIASCAALVATAMAFSIGTDTLGPMGESFRLSGEEIGKAVGPGVWGFAVSIILASLIVDALGIGRVLWLACLGHFVGTTVIVFFAQGFWSLAGGWLIIGLSNGLVEATINPLVATIYADKKSHMLNVLHAWWPGGLIIGGLLAYLLTKAMGLDQPGVEASTIELGWRIKIALVYLPTILYGFLMLGQKFPATERVQSGVSYGDMLKEAARPGFLLLLFCMVITASTELGPDKWVGDLIQKIIGIQGILFLIYTAGLMFVLRSFAGPFVHKFSPVGLLLISAALSCIGLFSFSFIEGAGMAFLAATIFGIGKTFFWPTMLGVTSERFPKGGALLLGLMGGIGMLSVGFLAIPQMGKILDHQTMVNTPVELRPVVLDDHNRVKTEVVKNLPPVQQEQVAVAVKKGAQATYKRVAMLPLILVVIFGGMFLYHRGRGGYKALKIHEQRT